MKMKETEVEMVVEAWIALLEWYRCGHPALGQLKKPGKDRLNSPPFVLLLERGASSSDEDIVVISDGNWMLRGGFAAKMAAMAWGKVARCGRYWRRKARGFIFEEREERKKAPRVRKSPRRGARRATFAMLPVLEDN
jgi:hypothetical protein